MARRACLACGKSLAKAHPRRRYCDNNDVCKRRYQRGARSKSKDRSPAKKTAAQKRAKAKPAAASDQEPQGIQSTEAATLIALAEAQKLGTPGGQAALVLARRIDQSHLDTGSGLASMVKRLQETLEVLTSDATLDDDPLDEFTRRREEKQRAAASG